VHICIHSYMHTNTHTHTSERGSKCALRVAKGTRPLSVDKGNLLVSLGHWWPRDKNDQNFLPLAILGSSTAEDPEGMQELQESEC